MNAERKVGSLQSPEGRRLPVVEGSDGQLQAGSSTQRRVTGQQTAHEGERGSIEDQADPRAPPRRGARTEGRLND